MKMINFGSLNKDKRYFWTNHSKNKLLQYGLSPTLVKKVIRRPERVEEGIASNTTAVMMRKDGKMTKREIWVMYQKKIHPAEYPASKRDNFAKRNLFHRVKIISAWIYPGVSPKGKEIFVPEDVWEELRK